MPAYILGSAAPRITPDVGSGPWCSEPQTVEFYGYKLGIEFLLDTEDIRRRTGPDAIAHMRHFLANTGTDYWLDMPAMLEKSEKLLGNLESELRAAQVFCETLDPGTHEITSSRPGIDKFTDNNLYYAIGGYTFWGRGSVSIVEIGTHKRHLTLDFAFHFYDRYNWDTKKSVTLGQREIKDSFMQHFHRQCYAREFDIKGLAVRHLMWDAMAPVPTPPGKTTPRPTAGAASAGQLQPMANPFDLLK